MTTSVDRHPKWPNAYVRCEGKDCDRWTVRYDRQYGGKRDNPLCASCEGASRQRHAHIDGAERYAPPEPNTPKTECAWAAGFFDGEGTAQSFLHSKTRRHYLYLTVANTDLYLLRRFRKVCGGSISAIKRQSEKHKQAWSLRVNGKPSVEAALGRLWPYLGPAKRAQVESAIARMANDPPIDPGARWRTRRLKYGQNGMRTGAQA